MPCYRPHLSDAARLFFSVLLTTPAHEEMC
jgi:hypothetical protein